MLAEKVRDLGLDRLGQQSTRPIAQDFGELIVDVSWLNQLDDVIFGHGISLLRWRSGGVKHPHDMPPFRFPPSPTFSDSSGGVAYFDRHSSNSFSVAILVALMASTGKRSGIGPRVSKQTFVGRHCCAYWHNLRGLLMLSSAHQREPSRILLCGN